MYNAYNMGVSEDQIANYQLVLQEMQEIKLHKETFNDFMENNKNILASKASELGLEWNHRSVIKSALNESDLDDMQRISVLKSMEWEDTGIYDDYEKFQIIDNILNQNTEAQSIYENVLLHQNTITTPSGMPAGTINITPTLQGTTDTTMVNQIFNSFMGGQGSTVIGSYGLPYTIPGTPYKTK